MDVVNQTSFQFAPLPGRLHYPKHSLTVIVKGTFDLAPNAPATPAEEQLPIAADEPYPDDGKPISGPRYGTDLTHFKPQADLLLVGKCRPPGGAPTATCQVTFGVGGKSKTLAVTGNRQWESSLLRSSISQPQPFTELELRYENSFGGEGYKPNPTGKGYAKEEKPTGEKVRLLPNIEDPADPVTSTRSKPQPAGFGPLARTWEPRVKQIGTYGNRWFKTRAPWFPEDMDWAAFNAAHPQMRVEGYLRGDEEVVLENIHPKHAQFRGKLPGLRLRCFFNEIRDAKGGTPKTPDAAAPFQPEHGHFHELPMKLDTLWVDAEENKLVLVWRGVADVMSDEFEEVAHLFIMSEPMDKAATPMPQCKAAFLESLPKPAPETDAKGNPIESGQPEAEAPAPDPAAAEPPPEDQGLFEDEGFSEILGGMDPKDAAALKGILAKQEAMMKEHLKKSGFNPNNPPPITKAQENEMIKQLKKLGVKDEDLAWIRDEEPEEIPPQPLTRELVEQRAANGESFVDEDLSGLDLSGLTLKGIDFSKADFANAVLKGADLSEAKLFNVNLVGADLSGANLAQATLSLANLAGADLSQASLTEADAKGANFQEANLTAAELEGAKLAGALMCNAKLDQVKAAKADFSNADFTGASFAGAAFEMANFTKAMLNDANLQGVNLQKAIMDGVSAAKANLEGADLTGFRAWDKADFTAAKLSKAMGQGSTWNKAILTEADFSYADMPEADFAKAQMQRANLYAANMKFASFCKADLKGARLVQMNLFRGLMTAADLTGADISGSNMYEVDFADAVVNQTRAEGTNYKKTKLYSG